MLKKHENLFAEKMNALSKWVKRHRQASISMQVPDFPHSIGIGHWGMFISITFLVCLQYSWIKPKYTLSKYD